jgi:lambda family phage tail tape measure protein
MAGDLRGQLDSTSVASLNAISDSLVDMTTGAKSAGDAFKDMANSIVRAIERMIIQMTIIKPLAAGLQSVLGGFAGGGGISIPGFNPISGVAGVHHGGYGPGDHFTTRAVNDNVFAFAPRFHTGIGPGERAAVIRDDESVLTPGQMRALAPAGRGDVNVTINGAPSTPTVTQRQNSNGGRDITIDFANAVTGVLTADAAKNGPIAKAFASRAAGFRGS